MLISIEEGTPLIQRNAFFPLVTFFLGDVIESTIMHINYLPTPNFADHILLKAILNVVIRDFKIWYGEAVVRRRIVKITSGDVMSRVPLRLSRRSLAFLLRGSA